MKIKPTHIAVSVLLLLAVVPFAKADQTFLFTDNLYGQFDLDRGQTMTKFVYDRAYTADDSVSSAIVSGIVANPSRAIISARLDVVSFLPSGTRIVYYLSNNNGSRWAQVNPGNTYSFETNGNELRWKAIIVRESPVAASAYLDSVNLTYTVSDSVQPVAYNNYNGGSLNSVVYGSGGDLQTFVCDALSSLGLGCGASQRVATPIYGQQNNQAPAPSQNNSQAQVSQPDNRNSGGSLQASIANVTVKRSASDDEVILVKTSATDGVRQTLGLNTKEGIFEIIRGQKHFIPTMDIFFDYGFDLSAVQTVTHKDLEPFPRSKLVKAKGDNKKTYYITEGLMIRLIPNKTIFNSYGDREEDVITISKKESSFYPRNQYVFLENPLSADVYQIVNDGSKRFVVPQVMKRLRIKQDQIAPINQTQLDAYTNGSPIVF